MDMIGAIDKWASVLIRSSAKELVGGHVRVSVTSTIKMGLWGTYSVLFCNYGVVCTTVTPAWLVGCCELGELCFCMPE